MNTVKLSVTIITYNEERNIKRCIDSVKTLADEIIVVDSYSTDNTKEICQALGVYFIEHSFEGYIEQKNFALAQATYDHILSLDADEALSMELCNAIAAVKSNWTHGAYRFNRLNNYYGYWIKHCGLYPETKLRLWNRQSGRWGGINPHDSVKLAEGTSVQHLKGDILHYAYASVEQHVKQVNNFTSIAAQAQYDKGTSTIPFFHLYLYPPLVFVNRYILKLGFLDGIPGLIVCKTIAMYKFLKYAKLKQLYQDHLK